MTTSIRPIEFKQFKGIPDLEDVFERAALKTAQRVAKLYEATWDTWDEKPELEIKVTAKRVQIRLKGKKAEHWRYIDEGTAPRDILPRPENESGMLHFQRGWQAKTTPGVFGSGSGGKSGKYIHIPQVGGGVTKQQSITARNWTPEIRKEAKVIMREEITKALRIRSLIKGR